ncbi:MAG: lipoyl(octanoyl) transferase [Gammaproteobacteria bacterium]|jgi:lipoyl(octanoyl) transferase
MLPELIIRKRGFCDYGETYTAMSQFTDSRDLTTTDEIWCLQHSPVYTLGLNGHRKHIINSGEIPVIETDRGGQVTYHGPGQLMVYLLVDIKRKSISVKDYVHRLEQSVIDMLEVYDVLGHRRESAPGVYVDNKKISALGIRVRKGCSYHGLSLNIDMDLTPYSGIHPCGYSDLEVTQMCEVGIDENLLQITNTLIPCLLRQMQYSDFNYSMVNEAESDRAA